MNPIWPDGARMCVDAIAGDCIETSSSARQSRRRGVLHYYGGRMLSYGYAREAARLEAAFHHPERVVRGEQLIRKGEFVRWAATPRRWHWRVRRAVEGRR
jgi:hypothetical protein